MRCEQRIFLKNLYHFWFSYERFRRRVPFRNGDELVFPNPVLSDIPVYLNLTKRRDEILGYTRKLPDWDFYNYDLDDCSKFEDIL